MSDAVADAGQARYRDFIKEVFIDPIRTAVVVDDEYPTLDDLLENAEEQIPCEAGSKGLSLEKRQNKATVKKIIEFCRGQRPTPWLIDVHDGTTPTMAGEQETASHFDHTDLLILDYHLDKAQGSERSIQILRQLAGNGHFNLVAVYTKDRESGDINDTIREIALSLAFPSETFELTEKASKYVTQRLEEWELINEGIFIKLMSSFDEAVYLKILESEITTWVHFHAMPELQLLVSLLDTIPVNLRIPADKVFWFLVWKTQEKFRERMSSTPFGAVTLGTKGGVNWIRTDTVFITVISKEHEPATIPEKLLAALEAWDPVPHRLIVSKMRAELSAHGGVAETEALRNRHLQVAWLANLLASYEPQRRTNVRQDVVRHWENLGGIVWPGVLRFSERLAEFLVNQDPNELTGRFDRYGVSQQQEAVHLHFNRYICSKPVEGHHLATGHVFKLESGVDPQFWLCLSPACDLEPGQGSNTGWKKRLGNWMPLKAVRLYPAKSEVALKESTRGYHVFLQIEDNVKVFGFANPTGETESVPTLRWEQFFAKNSGNFTQTKVMEIELARIGVLEGEQLAFKSESASIVGQLRYEYAINLLQRLGAHLSRVGLDFRKFSAPVKKPSC